jgi:hypothetical protein
MRLRDQVTIDRVVVRSAMDHRSIARTVPLKIGTRKKRRRFKLITFRVYRSLCTDRYCKRPLTADSVATTDSSPSRKRRSGPAKGERTRVLPLVGLHGGLPCRLHPPRVTELGRKPGGSSLWYVLYMPYPYRVSRVEASSAVLFVVVWWTS